MSCCNTAGPGPVRRRQLLKERPRSRRDHHDDDGGGVDRRVDMHRHALGVIAPETWMIGDKRLGIYAIWIDVHGDDLPAGSTIKPDRIIRSLTELLPDQAA